MDGSIRWQDSRTWLVGLAASLAGLHLLLVSRTESSDLLTTSLLFWAAAASLLWDRRESIVWNSNQLSTAIGLFLLTLLLVRSAALPELNSFLRTFPLVAALGLALLTSGLQNLRHYWREGVIFGLLFIQPLLEFVLKLVDLPKLTAQASTFMLWYTGFEVQRQGLFVQLPTGAVRVYEGCAGMQGILQLVNIAVLILLLMAVRSRLKIALCLLLAILTAFLVNAIRVAIMAVLVAAAQPQAFDYWHTGTGSLIFSGIAVALFGLICWFTLLRTPHPA